MAGLREQKRLLSMRAMEEAAVEIAHSEGIAAVTVERVCVAAKVSRSTFFNYFSSLEQAIFGTPIEYDPSVTQPILTRHHDDLVLAASLIVMTYVRADPADDLGRLRFALFAREPGVASVVSWASRTSRTRLTAVIADWLEAHPADARLADADHGTEARLTVALSITLGDEALRHLREVDGNYPIELAAFAAARRRLAAVGAPR